MGDPTLRLNPVNLLSGFTASAVDSTVSLSWAASTDTSIQGYLVYRAHGFGSFTRLTPSPIAATSYTDTAASARETNTYMVRAVKLETNGSGTYYNPSQGVFQTVNTGSGAHAVAIISPLDRSGYLASASVVIRASVSPGYAGSVDFYNGAAKLGTAASAPYTYQWNNVPTGTYRL